MTGYTDAVPVVPEQKGRELKMTGYADSDYAGDLNSRRSTTGYVFVYVCV